MQSLMEERIPNIVEVISVNIDESHPENSEIVMKKYDGCLLELIDVTKGNVSLTFQLLLPVIRALKILSENIPAIFHRDLKPENILYLKDNDKYELFLTDFGICFLNDCEERLTEEVTAIGARMFIAPEYEIGRVENVTEKGDIFSIGKIIWWMINGIENAVLPSNFWFVEDFDLAKRFPEDANVIAANAVIASCLRINPDERCNYDQLITMIENILNEDVISADVKKQYFVEVAMEKRKIQFAERLIYNKQLVNVFSNILLKALDKINKKYPTTFFLQRFRDEYASKAKDGVDFTSINVDNDASHYLYSGHFEDIYIPINYHPAIKGEKYAHISLEYNIRSSGKKEKLVVKYDEQGIIVADYQSKICQLNTGMVITFFEDLILNYIS